MADELVEKTLEQCNNSFQPSFQTYMQTYVWNPYQLYQKDFASPVGGPRDDALLKERAKTWGIIAANYGFLAFGFPSVVMNQSNYKVARQFVPWKRLIRNCGIMTGVAGIAGASFAVALTELQRRRIGGNKNLENSWDLVGAFFASGVVGGIARGRPAHGALLGALAGFCAKVSQEMPRNAIRRKPLDPNGPQYYRLVDDDGRIIRR